MEDSTIWWDVGPTAALFGLGLVGVVAFAVRSARRGLPRSPWLVRKGWTPLLGHFTMEYFYWFTGPVTRLMVRHRVSPNVLTSLSLAWAAGGGLLIAIGWFGLGGWVILVAAILDGLDGRVARGERLSSPAGAFWDATADRLSDALILLGFAVYYRNSVVLLLLVLVTLVASSMVSYARAKAEAAAVSYPGGPMQRHERIVYLGLGAGASPVVALVTEAGDPRPEYWLAVAALSVVAVLASFTATRRVLFTFRLLRERNSLEEAEGPSRRRRG